MNNRPLATEKINEAYRDLETRTTLQIVQALVDDQLHAVQAAQKAAPQIARAAELAAARMLRGGRLIYVGAGTSGRLGQLDASELPPTFSWPRERALACIAGGQEALWQAVEGAEDDFEAGRRDVLALQPTQSDVMVGIAASGTTPYPLGAFAAAREVEALTIGIANNPDTPMVVQCEVGIVLDTGPEVISGSTRLKAGTAQKIALNAFSSTLMVCLGKVYGNLMVDVQATNAKLLARAVRLTMAATGVSEDKARVALEACGYSVKTAIVMLKKGLDGEAAQAVVSRVDGNVRRALD
ncbi:N-acetylmuramic acid 6-phosphate etherase [uncultured Meiothermus sp.]|uniref:N-acetylmuramic acid 6-phosphate etherase n=1 Tax=uncultured Meiothermus sp. TaxID=157471 RepID=UPI0026075ECC|nr:N-acetylmuramic acid 6-phosphate etherase [uncultured Meiothermus sp.]